mmetsp:Transcript_24692/g.40663  ORF Transcript_24692/g.40663 Transcript_24692/m.40663 type:complete len:114 (+) Transcript_24692:2581-2922(+)
MNSVFPGPTRRVWFRSLPDKRPRPVCKAPVRDDPANQKTLLLLLRGLELECELDEHFRAVEGFLAADVEPKERMKAEEEVRSPDMAEELIERREFLMSDGFVVVCMTQNRRTR